MDISNQLTDDAILGELGKRIAQHRIRLQMTQAALADEAGIGKRTLERIEAGETAQMSSMVRVLRVLGLLPGLDTMIPEAGPGPMDQLRHKGKTRRRASSKKETDSPDEPWRWGDES